MSTKTVLFCVLILCFLGGCAAAPVALHAPHPYGQDLADPSSSWHQLRFKWRWSEDREPDWSLDALIADQVLSGVIERHQRALPLWRFHRRAAPDPAGHQFSFAFYGSEEAAGEVRDAVAGHPVTRRLLAQGFLEKEPYLTSPQRASELSATSDPRWPETLQATWPMYIMGVSQTWLALVESHARTSGVEAEETDMERQLARYSKVNDRVTKVWSKYAQHAFFHHLSGIFGYEPARIRKDIRF